MDLLPYVFGGIGGGLITGGVNFYTYRKSRRSPSGRAYEILRGLERALVESQGEHFVARSSQDNYLIANHLYNHADGPIIGTAFHENPATYGDADLARGFKFGGSLFTRLTAEDVCDAASATAARQTLQRLLDGAKLVIIPAGARYVRLDGVFCRLKDDTHLCFFSLRDPTEPANNRGVAFRDGIATHMFEYFQGLARTYA